MLKKVHEGLHTFIDFKNIFKTFLTEQLFYAAIDSFILSLIRCLSTRKSEVISFKEKLKEKCILDFDKPLELFFYYVKLYQVCFCFIVRVEYTFRGYQKQTLGNRI